MYCYHYKLDTLCTFTVNANVLMMVTRDAAGEVFEAIVKSAFKTATVEVADNGPRALPIIGSCSEHYSWEFGKDKT